MTTTQTLEAKVTYRKTKAGEWVAYGPANVLTAGKTVKVAKRDGSIKVELIARVGHPFEVDGREMCYGYLGKAAAQRPTLSSRYCCDECGEWHTDGDGTRCWETGLAH